MNETSQFLKDEKKHSGKLISLAVTIGTVNGLLLILQAWMLATVVNDVIINQQRLEDVLPWLLAMLAVLLIRSILAYLSEQIAFNAAARVKQSLRERLYRKLERLGPAYLTSERSGELATVLADGIEAFDAYYSKYLPAMSLAALIPLSILVFVFPIDWQSALVMLITAPLIPFFMILIGKGAERLNQKQWQQLQRMGGYFFDVIQGLTTLKLFNASQREARVVEKVSNDYRMATMKVLRVAFLSALALEFFATVSIAVVAVLIGFRLLFGEMDFLIGFFILLLAPEFYLPLRSLGTHYHSRMEAIGAAEKVHEILNQPDYLNSSKDTDAAVTQIHTAPFTDIHIAFNNVSFSYETGFPVIRNLNLVIQPGEKVAVIGPTGSGKTTLQNLLLGFIRPESGNVEINTRALNEMDLDFWHQHISWVPQRPHIFHGTVAENITLGIDRGMNITKVRHQQMELAASQANALEFIEKLPNGFNTIIGESGRALSGGQMQRLVLARAFLRDSPLIILDEATASLDIKNEALIQTAIDRLAEGRTVLNIAHRLSTVQNADKIIVLEHGEISQAGKHDQLMQQPGLYQQLITSQGLVS